MVLDPGTVGIVLEGGGKSVPVWIENGIEGISEQSLNPQSVFAAAGGPGRYGDYEPGFAFAEQRTWEGGRANEFFTDDPTRYLDSKGAWTLTPGKLAPAPLWRFGRGYRPNGDDFVLPGNMTWRPLYGDNLFIDIPYTPATNITADKVYVHLRRVGYPQNGLTLELCSDDGFGAPGSVLQTATVDRSVITDVLSVFHGFKFSGTQPLTGSTQYHIKIYGDTTNDRDSHWEIGTDADVAGGLTSQDGSSWSTTNYTAYYRVTGVDAKCYHLPFVIDEQQYFVSIYRDSTASKVYMVGVRGKATAASATTLTNSNAALGTNGEYVGARIKIIRGTGRGQVRVIQSHTATSITVDTWDITPSTDSEYIVYETDRLTEVSTTGLGVVTDVVVYDNIAIFAQGESVNIRKMRFNAGASPPAHEFADDGSNRASLLEFGYVAGQGVLWRGTNSTAVTVSRSNKVTWGNNHSFGSAIAVGSASAPITNLLHYTNPGNAVSRLAVFKTSENGFIDDDKWYRDNLNIGAFPEATNGVAATVHGLYKFYNWSNSMERQYGDAVDDIDPNREAGMPAGRQGYISCVEAHPVGIILGIDAGVDGTSSVLFFDGNFYHEIYRAFETGKRIRSLVWQPNQGGKKFLWVGVGDDLIYLEFPRATRNPLADPTQRYMWEVSVVSSVHDLGNSSMYKLWKDLAFVTKNFDGRNVKGYLDIRVDGDIDSDRWTHIEAGEIRNSPIEVVKILKGGAQQFQYRIRALSNNATVPPIFNGITVKAVGQTPYASQFTFWGSFGPVATELEASSEDALPLFTDGGRQALVWTVSECVLERLIGKKCMVSVAQVNPQYSTDSRDNTQAQLILRVLDD